MDRDTSVDEARFSLKRVWARNFKSIRELDLELGPLTVLVGPNASGKSNVLDVLRFINEAIDRNLDSAVTSRHGVEAVMRTSPECVSSNIEVGFEVRRGEFSMRYGFELGHRDRDYSVDREYGIVTPAHGKSKPIEFESREGRVIKPEGFDDDEFDDAELAIWHLPHIFFRFRERNRKPNIRTNRLNRRDLDLAQNFVKRMQFYRLFPDAMREPRRFMNPRILFEDGQNLASVLREMMKLDSPYLGEVKTNLEHVVPGLKDLLVDQSGGYLVVKLRHEIGANGGPASWFDLSQESDGTVRLLGLLTAFYQDTPNSLVGVEEPELTMHPGALSVLADVMVEASNRTQVVATTHSPDLIDRLPIESLRAVEMRDGCTEVGPVSETQANAVRQGLFTTGELHSMEGLVPSS